MTFLVYAHIDPRNGIPFYIGKGCEERASDFSRRSYFHKNLVSKIRSLNLEPEVVILHQNLTEQEAFELEVREIKFYGRRDLGEGPLINMTDGGEGSSGNYHSEETKKRIGDFHRGKIVSEETKLRMRISRASAVKREAEFYLSRSHR